MRDLKLPFRFDLCSLLTQAQQRWSKRIEGVELNLPFLTLTVRPQDLERKIAREIVIRMADRRVLNAFECCDDCINRALESLQKIRSLLVDKQVELADVVDGPLYMLVEFMLEAIRQFFTFGENLQNRKRNYILYGAIDLHRQQPIDTHEAYFSSLEMLRAHLHRCLLQVSEIANMKIPKISDHMRYQNDWQVEAYVRPELSK